MSRVRQSALSDFKGGKGRSPLGFRGDFRVRIRISRPGGNPDSSLLKTRPLAEAISCGLNVHTDAWRYTEAGVLFKDLRFLVGGLEILLILETNSGCLFLLRSSTLHLSVWLVANLAFRESVPQRHAQRFWHY